MYQFERKKHFTLWHIVRVSLWQHFLLKKYIKMHFTNRTRGFEHLLLNEVVELNELKAIRKQPQSFHKLVSVLI